MWSEKIAPKAPYDFRRALQRLAFDPIQVIDLERLEIMVPLYIRNNPVVASVKSIGTVEEPVMLVTCKEDRFKKETINRVIDLFHFDVSLAEVYEHFKGSELERLVEQFYGIPVVRDFSVYNCLAKCIIHQQLNLKFAFTLTERFVKSFGYEKEGVWFYPSPETVSELSYEQLREMQFSQRKAEYLIDTSRLIDSGELRLEEFDKMENQAIFDKLVKIRGIGPWTAESILLFGLGRENVFPVGDVGLQNAIKHLYGRSEKPKADEVRKMARNWEPYASYAALYLWESLGNQVVRS
ncbi:DNA-3-methyladenine glycosylase family protein [Pseudalkalibacillus caeni]|uniref:DNA-3-methyladenine glycosylase II n=1 Tax=Exobacillus caeni TaxID=2574798 RepID=A0A5R9EWT8_9BACL|nr:DNA-3-methyladenine glycosylase [Pseudalkalibacillus caeni]TLS35722.1 DNA-3-methyladenine glycosylase 2 family protein [Pseudalkalibacillus caeni]